MIVVGTVTFISAQLLQVEAWSVDNKNFILETASTRQGNTWDLISKSAEDMREEYSPSSTKYKKTAQIPVCFVFPAFLSSGTLTRKVHDAPVTSIGRWWAHHKSW